MKASSLFAVGLAIGALAVFGVRAMSLDDEDPAAHPPAPTRGPATDPAPETPPAVEAAHAGHTGTMPARAETPEEPPGEPSRIAADQAPENAVCPVMGNPVDPEITVDYEGRRIGFCCPGCDKVFLEDPEKYLKKVDAELARRDAGEGEQADAPAAEPLDPDRPPENEICPVMGNPVDPEFWLDHEGRRIGFCCPGCDRVFMEDPAKYLKKVDAELRRRAPK